MLWSNMTTLIIKHIRTTSPANQIPSSEYSDVLNPNRETFVLKGHNPKTERYEYILPISKHNKITLENLDLIFGGIEKIENLRFGEIDRILISIIDGDGSVLFYYASRGVNDYIEG